MPTKTTLIWFFAIFSLITVMPRGILTKVDMLSRVLRLKKDLTNRVGIPDDWSSEKIDAANYALNRVLNIIEEYYQ